MLILSTRLCGQSSLTDPTYVSMKLPWGTKNGLFQKIGNRNKTF